MNRVCILVLSLCVLSAFGAAAAPIAAAKTVEKTKWEIVERNEKGEVVRRERGSDTRTYSHISGGKVTGGANVLSGVSLLGSECHSPGAGEGEVVTAPLVQQLGWIDKASGEVGLLERTQKKKAMFASFTCGEAQVELRGSVVGRVTPVNTRVGPEEVFTNDIAVTEAGEEVYQLEGAPPVALEMQVDKGGFFPVGWGDLGELSVEAPFEISTASGTPKFKKVKEKKK